MFSQIIAADDFLTFKRMMHARSASLDFQAHLQYEKIRKSGMPGAAVAAMESCGQEVVSRNHEHHQQMIRKQQLQQSEGGVNPAHSENSDESRDDDDERLLQQAIGDMIFSCSGCSFRVVSRSLNVCRTFEACF